MPFITREDGERFIIPSYRDVLSAKKPALLKKEVMLLSTNYGEYITLQRKNIDQFEAAFSPDPGYLLGESVWNYFKRPRDLIYCEAIPNTTEAILVIVKAGSVYLDGSFPVDSIPDELIVFKTQQNNFEIHIYGDVPISETPEENKFSLDATSVKSFEVLTEPVFPTLPTNKIFQLRLVDSVLKTQGIGVFPLKKVLVGLVILGLIWTGFTYFTMHREEIPVAFVSAVNPLQLYISSMTSPAPANEIREIAESIRKLYAIPGWYPTEAMYNGGIIRVNVKSSGIKTSMLYQWARDNNAVVEILPDGIYLTLNAASAPRTPPTDISSLQSVIATILDRLSTVVPGNNLTLGPTFDKGKFSEAPISIVFSSLTLNTFLLMGEQLRGLPLVLSKVSITINNGLLSGTIFLKALGN